MPYLLTLANRNDTISVPMPKVTKASTIVAVACRCCWHYRLKYNANANYPIGLFLLTKVRKEGEISYVISYASFN